MQLQLQLLSMCTIMMHIQTSKTLYKQPLHRPKFLSEQCGEHGNPDLSGVLTTLHGDKEELSSQSVSSCVDGPLVSSCLDMKERCRQYKSGVYEIGTNANNVNFIYCAFENTYCNVIGPWVKLASWTISECGSSFPSGLQQFVNGTVPTCGIQEGTSSSCQSLPLSSSPVTYTQVCGKMRGYQKDPLMLFGSSRFKY